MFILMFLKRDIKTFKVLLEYTFVELLKNKTT